MAFMSERIIGFVPAQRDPAPQAAAGTQAAAASPVVGVVMGSDSDWSVMSAASEVLGEFGITHEVEVLSAHRTPDRMMAYGRMARQRGIRVIIAGAGGAAHLPGMLASVSTLPIVGVPVPLGNLDGLDSLLSIVQMPAGIPVATVSIGGARNAGLIAVQILATNDDALDAQLVAFRQDLEAQVADKNDALHAKLGSTASPRQSLGFGAGGAAPRP